MKALNKISRRVTWGTLSVVFIVSMGAAVLAGQTQPSSDTPSTQPSDAAQLNSFDRALIIPIRDAITDITDDSLERRLERVREEDFPLVIFELDTPGGALGATLEICDKIKALRDEGVTTYAWINNMAYSAGTIIALATDGILMVPNATIGDCQPIMITGGGPSALPEDIEAKATSPLLAELRDSVRRNKYNLDMVLALIRPEMQMFWLVNTETQERRFVDVHGRNELFGLPDRYYLDDDEDEDEDGKRKSRRRRRTPVEPISDSKSETSWKYVKQAEGLGEIHQPVVSDRVLLTMRTVEALAYGFCKAKVADEAALRDHFNISGVIERMENNWIEAAIEWLASPTVRGVLFLLMLLGAYAEFQAPGFGLPGGAALVALIIFLGAPYLAGYAVTWEIVAIVLGIALIAVEAFVIPGFGAAGILGMILLFAGLLFSFAPAEPGFDDWPTLPTFPATYTYLKQGLLALAGGMTGSIIGMFLVAKYLPRVPMAGHLIAANPTHEQVTIDDPYGGAIQTGDVGTTEGPLRPAGKARFGQMMVDVVTQGDYIEEGTRVEVAERHGNRVVVRRVS